LGKREDIIAATLDL